MRQDCTPQELDTAKKVNLKRETKSLLIAVQNKVKDFGKTHRIQSFQNKVYPVFDKN